MFFKIYILYNLIRVFSLRGNKMEETVELKITVKFAKIILKKG